MNPSKTLFSLLLFVCCGLGLSASAKSRLNKVYMFGFAASFTDSVVYITDIQAVDSVYLDGKTGFLAERSLYSTQLQSFVEQSYGKSNATCAVFYNVSRKKLEKEFLSVRSRYSADRTLLLKAIGGDEFRFQAETHHEE